MIARMVASDLPSQGLDYRFVVNQNRAGEMNKSEFIDKVAERADLTREAAARVVDAIFDTASGAIAEAVHAAGSISIPGFGKFTKRTRAARTGRNPRTGTEIVIPERTTIGFTSARKLRDGSPAGRPTGNQRYRTIKKAGDTGGLDRALVRDAVVRAGEGSARASRSSGGTSRSSGSSRRSSGGTKAR